MNWPQRAILIFAGVALLFFAFVVTFDQYGTGESRPWLATALFLVAVAMFFLAAKPTKPLS